MPRRVARVYPSDFSSVMSLGVAVVFVFIGLAMMLNGIPVGFLFLVMAAGTGLYHFANLRGRPVPSFEVAVLPDEDDDRLETLARWHRDGLVSDEEYEAKRREILARL